MVVQEQAEAQQPGRTQSCVVRQNETKGADDVGRDLPEDFALDQRLANQPELIVFQIAQAAMHELRRPGRRPARQIIHFTKKNRIASARGIAGDAAAIDAASDDSEVVNPIQGRFPRPPGPFTLAIWLSVSIKSQLNPKAIENGKPMSFETRARARPQDEVLDSGGLRSSWRGARQRRASRTIGPWTAADPSGSRFSAGG
jgi:hypothetical protein